MNLAIEASNEMIEALQVLPVGEAYTEGFEAVVGKAEATVYASDNSFIAVKPAGFHYIKGKPAFKGFITLWDKKFLVEQNKLVDNKACFPVAIKRVV